ncbi:uncharacterized protein EDB93DRAFT_1102293 [Suillus bovinus]|uniref:uncharacterized protein n=1 Tax=Suillus bovinus TaxID=48563 RepID=UPI001B8861CE|nr:uncharacterized protein EDB93DRAFT_1102293 [Suillus bovinus]KAG2154130.1 hypothetical protein EDB93DRAFT_1102293 [Suillus bovinus]
MDELHCHFTKSLHKVMESSYFSDLVIKCIQDAHANEIKKLCGVELGTVGASSESFIAGGSSTHTNVMKWSVQQVTPDSIAWAAVIVIFLLLLDTKFSSTDIGKRLTLNYKELFFTYKKVLVSKWNMKHIV